MLAYFLPTMMKNKQTHTFTNVDKWRTNCRVGEQTDRSVVQGVCHSVHNCWCIFSHVSLVVFRCVAERTNKKMVRVYNYVGIDVDIWSNGDFFYLCSSLYQEFDRSYRQCGKQDVASGTCRACHSVGRKNRQQHCGKKSSGRKHRRRNSGCRRRYSSNNDSSTTTKRRGKSVKIKNTVFFMK